MRRICQHSDLLLSQLKLVPWLLSWAVMKGCQVLKLLLAIISSFSSSREYQRRSDARKMRGTHGKSEKVMFILCLASNMLNGKALKIIMLHHTGDYSSQGRAEVAQLGER